MEYLCRNEKSTWKGSIENLILHEQSFEADVKGRGSRLHIIVGKYEHGAYLCIPSWRVGCELAGYQDSYWNLEQLEGLIGTVDAITVVTAIRKIYYLFEEDAVE